MPSLTTDAFFLTDLSLRDAAVILLIPTTVFAMIGPLVVRRFVPIKSLRANNEVAGLTVRNSAGVQVAGNLFVGDGRMVMLVSQDVGGTWPLKDVSITDNFFKGWRLAAGIHSSGNEIKSLTAAGMKISADRNVYDPSGSTELTFWSYTGWVRSLADMRSKLGWEANGRVAPVASPL